MAVQDPPTASHLDFCGVLRRRDPLFDERIPIVAMRALPEELGAAITATDADVRVEIEDRVLCQLGIAIDEPGWMVELAERAPDGLMNAERVRILNERNEEQVQRLARLPTGGEMPRQRQARSPVLRVLLDEPSAEARKALGIAGPTRQRLEPIEGEIGAVGRDVDQLFPDGRRFALVPFGYTNV